MTTNLIFSKISCTYILSTSRLTNFSWFIKMMDISLCILVVVAGFTTAVDLEREVKLLREENARLWTRLETLEQEVNDRGSSARHIRQNSGLFEGPFAFTYRLDTKKVDVHNGDAIKYPIKITDFGGGYDNTTGVYTAPRTGLYLFSCSILADQEHHSNPQVHASLMVDGMPVAKVLAFSENGNHRDQGATTVFVRLSAGSQVWVRAIDASRVTVGGDMYTVFAGYLLWQE